MNAEMQNAEFKKTSGCWLLASGSIRNFFQLIRFYCFHWRSPVPHKHDRYLVPLCSMEY